jgi:hypothetical protein
MRAMSVWSRAWDGSESPWAAAVFRVAIAAIVLVRTNDWLRPIVRLDHHAWVRSVEYAPSIEAVHAPALHAPLWAMPKLPDSATTLAVHARTVLAVLLLFGVLPRLSAGLLGVVGYGLMAADRFRYMHHLHLLWVSCLLLALVPSGERLGVMRLFRRGGAEVPRWSTNLLRLQLLVVYASAGISKLSADWLGGRTLARYDAMGLVSGPVWRAVSALGPAPAAFGVAATEIAAVPLLLYRATRAWTVAALIAFHLALHASMMLSVFTAIMIAYLALFLPYRSSSVAAVTES